MNSLLTGFAVTFLNIPFFINLLDHLELGRDEFSIDAIFF